MFGALMLLMLEQDRQRRGKPTLFLDAPPPNPWALVGGVLAGLSILVLFVWALVYFQVGIPQPLQRH